MQTTRGYHSVLRHRAIRGAADRSRRAACCACRELSGCALSPAIAQSAAAAQQATRLLADAIKQREQELEAARDATAKRGRTAGETEGRYRGDRPGSRQAQSAIDRHRRPVCAASRPASARPKARLRPLDAREQEIRALARFAPRRDRGSARGPAARRPPHAAGFAGPARGRVAIAAHRDAARRRRAGNARPRGEARRRSRRTRRACARPSPPSAIALARDRDKLKDEQIRLAALVEERQRKQSAIEKDMEAEGARAHRPVEAGRQPAGPDREDGAGSEERGQGGRRPPACRAPRRRRRQA